MKSIKLTSGLIFLALVLSVLGACSGGGSSNDGSGQSSSGQSNTAEAGAGTATMSFTVTDPDTGVSSPSTAPFGFRVDRVNADTGEFEVTILPTDQMVSLTPGSDSLDWLIQPAIAQTGNQIVISGGSLTGTVDLVNGGEASAEGALILGTGEGINCDCPVLFTVQYNSETGRMEFDLAGFELDYDISEFTDGGTCAELNLNLTELGDIMITSRPESIVVTTPSTSTEDDSTPLAGEYAGIWDLTFVDDGRTTDHPLEDGDDPLEFPFFITLIVMENGEATVEDAGICVLESDLEYQVRGNTIDLSNNGVCGECTVRETGTLTFTSNTSVSGTFRDIESCSSPGEGDFILSTSVSGIKR